MALKEFIAEQIIIIINILYTNIERPLQEFTFPLELLFIILIFKT